MPHLDALRAFAVVAVMVHHFVPNKALPGILERVPWGDWGVQLFFVLSGFLITGILLRARDGVETVRGSRMFAMRQFYARRFLRIFPLYYFVIFVALLIDLGTAREIKGWLLTHTLNVHMTNQGYFEDHFAHFWSLNVEEHFYLVWPWLVLFLTRSWLLVAMVLSLVISPLFRITLYRLESLGGYVLAPGSLDSLALGSLLAFLFVGRVHISSVHRYLSWIGLPVGLSVTVATLLWPRLFPTELDEVLSRWSIGLVFCWLVSTGSRGFPGWAGRFMASRPLVYVGKISYGIYVYHPLMPGLVVLVLGWTGLQTKLGLWPDFLLYSAASIGLAALSWHLMERPINDLKRHFRYRPGPTTAVPQDAQAGVGASPGRV